MENRVYYGEYSLKHWIELILKQDIVLPPYQRVFVWKEKKVRQLIESFKNDEFVPPITIGASNIKDINVVQNIIIDGQQRLTSILLAFLNVYPKKDNFKANELSASENDDELDSEEDREEIIDWTFSKLLNKGHTKESILSDLGNAYTRDFGTDLGLDDIFFKSHYLGFSYLVPENKDIKSQQKYYSSVFRNINRQGVRLQDQESRAALYYLDDKLPNLFKPDYCKEITINNLKIDFLRSLSIVSQFKKRNNSQLVAKGYRNKMEEYYEKYIYATIQNKENDLFELLTNEYRENILEKLGNAIKMLGLNKDYTSIIDFDVYFFGLVYFVVFESKSIKYDDKNELSLKLTELINTFKGDYSHSKSPSCLKHLRNRLQKSIDVYRNYIE